MLLIAQLIYFHLFQFEISSADCSLQTVTFIIPANDSTIFSLNLISNRPLMLKFFHRVRELFRASSVIIETSQEYSNSVSFSSITEKLKIDFSPQRRHDPAESSGDPRGRAFGD